MQDIHKIGILMMALACLIGGGAGIQAHAQSSTQGWYTLFQRHECNPGDRQDGGCWLNSPHNGQLQLSNDPKTNEWLLKDFINSKGSGHFIPNNLQGTYSDIQKSIQNNDFSSQFVQCQQLKDNGIDIDCNQLATQGATNIPSTPNVNNPATNPYVHQFKMQNGGEIIVVPNNQSGPVLPQQQAPQTPQGQQPEYGSGHNSGAGGY